MTSSRNQVAAREGFRAIANGASIIGGGVSGGTHR
jgi:hypothetical protein